MKPLFVIFVFLFPSLSHAWFFGPRNYEDCVLENIKTAKTDSAVGMVYRMCRDKFPEKIEKKNLVQCGRSMVDPNEYGSTELETPFMNKFSAEITRIEQKTDYGGQTSFIVFIKSSFPSSLSGLTISGYEDQNKKRHTGDYACSGFLNRGTVGKFQCFNIDPRAKWFSLKTVITEKENVLSTLRKVELCK